MPDSPKNASCVLIGADSLLMQCGEILIGRGFHVAAVVSKADAVLDWARQHSLPTHAPGKKLRESLGDLEFDYLFSITNLSIIPEDVLALARVAAINFHDGPLPRYAGMYTPAWALLNGEETYGVSFHDMHGEVDTGDLYVQRLFDIAAGDTSLSLNTRCFEMAMEAFDELAERIATNTTAPTAQDLSQRSYFARHQRPTGAALCDWSKPAAELDRLIRALDFGTYENAFAAAKILHGGKVVLPGTSRMGGETDAAAGTLISISGETLTIACGDGTSIVLSDLRCPLGHALDGTAAAARMGISEGAVLHAPDAGLVERLDAFVEAATPSEAYWVRRLARLESAEMPYLRSDRADAAGYGETVVTLTDRFKDAFSADPAVAVVAGFAGYLARVNGRTQFDLTLDDRRGDLQARDLGELVSPVVPLPLDVNLDQTVRGFVGDVSQVLTKAGDKLGYLSDVVARYPHLRENPILASGRLASVAVVLADGAEQGTGLSTGTDFALVIEEGGTRVRALHDDGALSGDDAARIAHQLGVFLDGMADASRRVTQVPMLDTADRTRVLKEWNQTAADFDRTKTVHALFEERVAQTPEATAVVFEGESLTYAELSARANGLARVLVDRGIGPDKLVGVYVERSIDMVVSILGVMKAGGAYVPLDPTYPEDRIAYMLEDSGAPIVITQKKLADQVPSSSATPLFVDDPEIGTADEAPSTNVDAANLAYTIYTSGSTGKPKGVMVEHRNAVNFFVGMDDRVPHDPAGTWLAVTSLSFDISVLELLWTLTRGFKIVVFTDHDRVGGDEDAIASGPWRPIDFGLALWGSDAGPGPRKYELMLESAKFGDAHGFSSVMTPERHFGAFGGPFPNPSVTSAAIAAVTENIQIRAGSCVLPLHHPIRVAEEWAVVDNLSGGRVAISFASGWQPNDFVIRPEAFATAKTGMVEGARQVQALWRGEAVEFENPNGDIVPTKTLPRPVQAELPSWLTTAGNIDTFRAAGAGDFNVLTHLLGQNLEELAEKITAYREARAEAGLDPAGGTVTCMLHTFVGEDNDAVRELVREPMKEYLRSAMALVVGFAWSFPAFQRPGGEDSKPEDVDLSTLTDEETDAILEFAFERYYETSGLFGTPEICGDMVDRVKAAGIDEITCLIDFGVDTDVVLAGLPMIDAVREAANRKPAGLEAAEVTDAAIAEPGVDYSLAAQVDRHQVTHLQCTPSHAAMLLAHAENRAALTKINHLMIGGEAFPTSLAAELDEAGCTDVTNMYGPTETTIWSSTERVSGRPETISIGTPIANTQLYVLGNGDEPLPVGVAGELLIGGEGVVRGYFERPELTAERFIPDPFSDREGARLYRTGDLARWAEDGTIDFLGRLDHQVKIRGYRIELGEIEARLSAIESLREAVVIAREDTPGDLRLVAYLIAEKEGVADDVLRTALREHLPEFMLPSAFVFLDRYPQTPNGKIDRKALPAPNEVRATTQAEYKPPSNELESMIASVWTDVLHLEQVGVDDNFFDLGGHSLLVVQAHRKLREQAPQPISLTDLYRYPTIRGLAGRLSSDKPDGEAVKQSSARGEKRRQAMNRRRGRGRK